MLHLFGLIITLAVLVCAAWTVATPQVFLFGAAASAAFCYFAFPYIFQIVRSASAPALELEDAPETGTGRGVLAVPPPERRIVISDPQKIQELWDAIGPVGMANPAYRAYLAIQWALKVSGVDPQIYAVGLDLSDARYVVLTVRRDPIEGT